MNAEHQLLQAADEAGLLPEPSGAPLPGAGPSWIVMAMGYLGAVPVALLSLGVLSLLTAGKIFSMPGSLFASLFFTTGGVVMLRRSSTLFWEQLAFTGLLIGQVMWMTSWGLPWQLHSGTNLVLTLLSLLVLQLIAAWAITTTWVLRLLGMIAAWTFLAIPLLALGTHQDADLLERLLRGSAYNPNLWVLSVLWAVCCATQPRWSGRAWAPRLSALTDGAAVTLLLQPLTEYGLNWLGLGPARFLVDEISSAATLLHFDLATAARVALVLASAWWLMRRQWPPASHPSVRRARPWLFVAYAMLALASCFMPAEAIAVVATIALGTGRKRLLWLALAALLMQLSNFYYMLNWSLMDKSRLLLTTGIILAVVLIGLRVLGGRGKASSSSPDTAHGAQPTRKWLAPVVMLATVVVALGLVQQDVNQKEQVIAQGQRLFVRLAPVDPRSLMQGDYMALNFSLPASLRKELDASSKGQASGTRHVMAKLDARGVAEMLRLAPSDEPVAQGEVLLPLKYMKGRWSLVTDAYFFPEGQGNRFSRATYGEFRVLPGGRALLVGLADDALQAILPAP